MDNDSTNNSLDYIENNDLQSDVPDFNTHINSNNNYSRRAVFWKKFFKFKKSFASILKPIILVLSVLIPWFSVIGNTYFWSLENKEPQSTILSIMMSMWLFLTIPSHIYVLAVYIKKIKSGINAVIFFVLYVCYAFFVAYINLLFIPEIWR